MAILLFLFIFLLGAYGCQPGVLKTPPPATLTRIPSATQTLTAPIQSQSSATTTELRSLTPLSTEIDETIPPTNTLNPDPTFTETAFVVTETIENTPTEYITATITRTATKTLKPTRTPYPTNTRRPTRTPTITPTPMPPLAYFRINNLSMYSKVVSPVRPESIISPGEDGLVHVEIINPDGDRISNEVFNYSTNIGRHFLIAPEIDFMVDGVAELARLQVSSYDRFQRTMWLTSVDLILLAIGENQITAPTDFTEPYIIRQPVAEDEISGGMLEVSGLARILTDTPLMIECIDPQGDILCSDEIQLHAPMEGVSHIPFSAFLPYEVRDATNIRLTFRQESSNRIPGTISLYSFEITLLP